MKRFTQHEGIAAPLIIDSIDTDQIIPSREIKRVSKEGLGEGLFAGWRTDGEFVLNQPRYKDASILLGGKNFGCGSSREHAVWALLDYGFRVVIAESFGRIFHRNCARNGLLAIELPAAQIAAITDLVFVDLENCEIRTPGGDVFAFNVREADRHMLLNGLDFIEFTLQHASSIDAFAVIDRKKRPWAWRS